MCHRSCYFFDPSADERRTEMTVPAWPASQRASEVASVLALVLRTPVFAVYCQRAGADDVPTSALGESSSCFS
jgi:hypothetical protein